MDFCGLGLELPVPDHSTICRWRERFRQKGIFDKAFHETNAQLENKGIQIKNGMILDATIVESSARPRKVVVIDENSNSSKPKLPELVLIKNENDEFVQESGDTPQTEEHETIETNTKAYIVKTTYSSDPDASWGYQRGFRFGYKDIFSVNSDGFVNGYLTTKANVNEVTCIEKMIEIVNPAENTPFLGDKGFESAKNDKILEDKKLKNHIMKKQKNTKKPDSTIKEHNKKISRSRFVVERTIGTIKNCFRMGRARYIGINKVQNDLALGCIVHNLVRAAGHFFVKEKILPVCPVLLIE
jgi:IS5 family transposase